MRKIGDLMLDLGFNENSPQSTKEAFIKHLIKSAYGFDVKTPSERRAIETCGRKVPGDSIEIKSQPEQLSFQFSTDEKNSA